MIQPIVPKSTVKYYPQYIVDIRAILYAHCHCGEQNIVEQTHINQLNRDKICQFQCSNCGGWIKLIVETPLDIILNSS